MRNWIFPLFLLIFATLSLPAQAQTITMVADKWCPYNCEPDSSRPGYMVEIVRAAMKKSGIDVVYKVLPWSQAIERTRSGEFEALIGAGHGDAPDFIFPEVLQGISINQFWVRADSHWKYEGIASISHVRVGIVENYSYGKVMDAYLKKKIHNGDETIRVIGTENATELNIADLLSGKVDTIIEDKNVVQYYFASRGLPLTLKPVGNPVDSENIDDTFIYVAFSPANPRAKEYAELLTQGVKQMRKSGELRAILANYKVDDSFHFLGSK